MPVRCSSAVFVFALAAAGAVIPVRAAGALTVVVQERALVMPKLPDGADVPMNLPADGAVKMPFVSGGAAGVAPRINAAVWREMLDGATAPTRPGKTFTPRPDKLPQGTSSLTYTAHQLPAGNPRLLSLAFSGEGCGAYCEEFTTTRIFDLRDGREIALGDLLTVAGFAAVGHRVDAARRGAYQKQIRAIRAALKSSTKGRKKGDDDDDDDERLMLNQTCLKDVDSEPSTPRSLVDDVFALDGQGGMVMTVGRCSNHAMRALDDVDEVKVVLSATDLKSALTSYGLSVVQQIGDAPPPAPFAGRDLHGLVAGAAVTLRLDPLREGVDTRGSYAYDKFHTPIGLSVRQDGGQVSAIEQADSRGEFELTPSGGTLVGTWRDKDHRKTLPVILQ